MAHIQYNDVRVSGQTRDVALNKSMIVEVWGPWHGEEEYLLVSSDPSVIDVTPMARLGWKNTHPYKVTAKAFGPTAQLTIVDGKLNDAGGSYSTGNLQANYAGGDWLKLNVQPSASNVLYADYFAEVIPAIIAGMEEFSAGGTSFVSKGGFLLVQTYGEQSPSVTKKPSLNGNRMFNVQALVTRDGANKITGTVPGQEESGVTIKDLKQGEGRTNATRQMLSSPTFNYDTPKRAVTHYFKILKQRYMQAYGVITDANGSFAAFAGALQSAGYATDGAYAANLIGLSSQAISQARAWLQFRLQTIDHDDAVAGGATRESTAERARLARFLEELRKFK
jgi:hypothetical protein